jgi:arylsulfatase A-like enzyme
MNIKHLAIFFALSAFFCGQSATADKSLAADKKPNILVILADDMGYGDLSCYNPDSAVKTPNIDRLAAEGVRFTDFYAQNCCTPTRAALMTGCYAKRVGLDNGSWSGTLGFGDPRGLNPEETTIAELFKQRGYVTGMIGKWHLGDQPEFWPRKHGFDEFFGTLTSASGPDHARTPPAHLQKRGGKDEDVLIRDDEMIAAPFEEISKLPAMFAGESAKFIARHKDRPFFLYMPHTAMHGPANPSPAWRGKSGKDNYADLLLEFDDSVGQTLAALEKSGLADNTLVIFFSDNGGGGHTTASNYPLRHNKGSMWEGGSRVPAIARWPGRIPAGVVCREIANVTDLLPTLVGIVDGKPYKSPRTIDGLDVSGLFFDPKHAKSPRSVNVYWIADEVKAIREGKWKYVDFKGGRLFDLEADPGEKEENNLIAQHPEVAQRLKKLMADAMADLGGPGEHGPGCRPCGMVAKPKFPVPTVDGLTEPDWNDPRWTNPGDVNAWKGSVEKKKTEAGKMPDKAKKQAKPKKEKPTQ